MLIVALLPIAPKDRMDGLEELLKHFDLHAGVFHTGNICGIWLHGAASNSYARAPRASDGCVVLSDGDLSWVADRLNSWRRDWESRDAGRYLSHYARSFRAGNMDHAAYSAYKRRVISENHGISVRVENVSVIRSPGEGDLVEVRFDQDYRSNRFAQRSRKQQFWNQEGGQWKIAYEGSESLPAVTLPESYRSAGPRRSGQPASRRGRTGQ